MCFLCIIITKKIIYSKIVYCIFLFKQRIEIFRCISAVNTGIYICGTGLCHAKIDDLTSGADKKRKLLIGEKQRIYCHSNLI